MKKIILIASLYMMALHCAGQVSVGPFAGMTANRSVVKTDTIKNGTEQNGWRAGVIADIPLSRSVSLRPSIAYEQYLMRFKGIAISCIATYNVHFKNNGYLFAGAGPFAIVTTNRMKMQYPIVDSFEGFKLAPLVKPNCVGLHANVGYQFANGIFVTAHYERTERNLLSTEMMAQKYGFNDIALHTTNWGICAGYLLRISKKETPEEVLQPQN